MPLSKRKREQQARLIEAGRNAQELRRQLAVTWLASEEIIQSMRALRQAIPIGDKTKRLPDSTDQT
ncbi:MAG: hypothetical protein P8X74_16955 [Reinekea sp.]